MHFYVATFFGVINYSYFILLKKLQSQKYNLFSPFETFIVLFSLLTILVSVVLTSFSVYLRVQSKFF